MSEEKNNSLRKFAHWRNCVTPKSSRNTASPQTPLGERGVTNPFVPIHDNLHQPFCSPGSYYSAISSHESLQGITEENSDVESSPKQRQTKPAINGQPAVSFWSPEQQALLCPVYIDEQDFARQAKAEARALLHCSCSYGSAMPPCRMHAMDVAHHAKLRMFWSGPTGPPDLQSPASSSPPSAQLRRLQAVGSASSRVAAAESPDINRQAPIGESQYSDGSCSVGIQTDFTLPPHMISQVELCVAFHAANAHFSQQDSIPPIEGCVGIGRIHWSPSEVKEIDSGQGLSSSCDEVVVHGGPDMRRRRSRQARDDGALTPKRPPSFGATPVMSIRRRSFGELDISPIRGEWAPSAEENSHKDQPCQEFRSEQSPPSEAVEMSVDERSNNCISPVGFARTDVMSSTYYNDTSQRVVDSGEKISSIALDLDNGYQSMALSTNCNCTN